MPDDTPERPAPNERSEAERSASSEDAPGLASDTKPLSRTASKLFVIASLLFIVGGAAGGTYFLLSIAQEAPTGVPPSMDTTRTDTAAVDSTTRLDAANPLPSGARQADEPDGN